VNPNDGVVFHFSEDPNITQFIPHVARTAEDRRPLVWAVGEDREPDYWFPRQCPRAMAWTVPDTTDDDRRYVLGPGAGSRVHAIEYAWIGRLTTCQLYRYALPAQSFRLSEGEVPHAYVSDRAVDPLGPPEALPPLLALHERAGIQLLVLENLWPWWDEVTATTLGHSGIRLANARPR
jgi:hypothetical protein